MGKANIALCVPCRPHAGSSPDTGPPPHPLSFLAVQVWAPGREVNGKWEGGGEWEMAAACSLLFLRSPCPHVQIVPGLQALNLQALVTSQVRILLLWSKSHRAK